MVSVYEVPAEKLIFAVAEDLKKKVKEPEYVNFVKTGVCKDRAPDLEDWWHIRLAAVLRKFYSKDTLGVEILRGYFGGLQKRGTQRPHFEKASGKIIRDCVQSLEKLGYLEKTARGRRMTQAGRQYLDSFAKKVNKAE
jgi:small subunit ribosomal protein S19e